MKSIATLLAMSLLFGSAWADSRKPVKPLEPEVQVPFSFLPPKDSIFTDSTLKPIQERLDGQVLGDMLVPVSLTPLRPLAPCQIQGINATQSKGLAQEIARFLATQHPAQTTTIQLLPPENRKLQAFDSILEPALRQQGFAFSRVALAGAVQLSYQISRTNREIFIRLMVNQTTVTRLYRDDLVALTPFTLLKEGGQPE